MASIMSVPFMLVFHQSECISAIKRMLFYYLHIYIFDFIHVFVFLITVIYACTSRVACGSEDVYIK